MRKCIEDVTALQLRLKKIIGQLTGVQKMLAEDIPCEDILAGCPLLDHLLDSVQLANQLVQPQRQHCRRFQSSHNGAKYTIPP